MNKKESQDLSIDKTLTNPNRGANEMIYKLNESNTSLSKYLPNELQILSGAIEFYRKYNLEKQVIKLSKQEPPIDELNNFLNMLQANPDFQLISSDLQDKQALKAMQNNTYQTQSSKLYGKLERLFEK